MTLWIVLVVSLLASGYIALMTHSTTYALNTFMLYKKKKQHFYLAEAACFWSIDCLKNFKQKNYCEDDIVFDFIEFGEKFKARVAFDKATRDERYKSFVCSLYCNKSLQDPLGKENSDLLLAYTVDVKLECLADNTYKIVNYNIKP